MLNVTGRNPVGAQRSGDVVPVERRRCIDHRAWQIAPGSSSLHFSFSRDTRGVRLRSGDSSRQYSRPRSYCGRVFGDKPGEVRERVDRDVIRQRSSARRGETKRPFRLDKSLWQIYRQSVEARDSTGDRHSDFRAFDVHSIDARGTNVRHQLRLHRRWIKPSAARRANRGDHRRWHSCHNRVHVERPGIELEVVPGHSAGEIHRTTHVDEATAGDRHLRVDRHIVDVTSQMKRTRRHSTQAKTRCREAADGDERQRMHLHIHIDPQQTSRSEGEATGTMGYGATVDMRDVAHRRHDRRARAIQSRSPAQRTV